ncbi:MAG: sigma-54-dependent Fis family transcriptional regulator, partial [Acidobacteria bacterium]|nr:sigma-54-dependent Fis family transcriptional regulator [Acidobacteriota bacterium]
MANRALIVDDDKLALDLLAFHLTSDGFTVDSAEIGSKGLDLARSNEYDVILTDLNLPDINGIEMVKRSKEISPATEIIVVTGEDSAEKAIEATRMGAFGYIVKDGNYQGLMVDVRNAVERKQQTLINSQQAREIEELRGRLTSRNSYEGVIGGARSMQNIYEIIENVAESDANILILGESGTGKEVIANAVHYKSHRSVKPFVKVNCSALPKDLIESQLFGHIKGSFTGANSDKVGFIGQASGGSLLLDEIGEMPIDLQPKLLRVLQEKVFYRVGSDKPQDADFRLVCSTNRNPFEAIQDGNLREDLYYRINTIEIKIPSLRERMEDVPMLAEHFLEMYGEKYKRDKIRFSQTAYNQMLNYSWRGNVRELQHVIERAILLSKSDTIDSLDIRVDPSAIPVQNTDSVNGAPMPTTSFAMPASNGTALAPDLSGEALFEEFGKLVVDRLDDPADGTEQSDVFNSLESGIVLAALRRTRGNKQAAANLLGLYRPRLYGMIKRHNLD